MSGAKSNLNEKSVRLFFRGPPTRHHRWKNRYALVGSASPPDLTDRGRDLLLRKQRPRVAMRDLFCHGRRQLREPATIARHNLAVGSPAFGDPGIGAEQETVGISLEQASPFGRKLPRPICDAASIARHNLAVGSPAFGDPGIGAEQETVGSDTWI